MVNKYTVHDAHTYEEEAFMRVATLSVSDKSQKTIAKSLDKRWLDGKVFNSITSSNNLINEIYFNMDLNQLRSFVDDIDQFGPYARTNSAFLNAGALNILFINLKVGTEKLTSDEIECLNHILTWGSNDLYLMPSLQFEGIDRHKEIELYEEFVSQMIESKDTFVPGSLNLGINVPSYYRYKDLNGLFSLYDKEDKEPTFVSVDFKRTGFDDNKRIGIVDELNAHYKKKDVVDYFLYGFNVRNYRKKRENPVSDEMRIARKGFNAVGAPHYDSSKRMIPPTTRLNQLGVIFDIDDYRFHSLTEQKQYDRFIEWSSDFDYTFDLVGSLQRDAPKARTAMKKFNLCMENKEFFEISDAVRRNDTDIIKDKLNKGNETP